MKVGFIGHGNMAKAMIKGMNISVNISNGENNQGIVDSCDVIFLTVKPQKYGEVLKSLKNLKNKILVSVAPGISIKWIENLTKAKVIRTMPNTPALVGQGVTAICKSKAVSKKDYASVVKLLKSFSMVYEISEKDMDMAIALSGSSPVIAFTVIDAMIQFAKSHCKEYSISENKAKLVAANTLIGAAKLLLESNDMPQGLVQKVCSKGGTTEKMVEALQKYDLAGVIKKSMLACLLRAKEMKK